MTDKNDYFDVNAEPARFEGQFTPDPCEQRVEPIDGHEDEISTVRDSVLNEPAFTGELKQAHLGEWMAQKRAQCTLSGNLTVTLVAALASGPFAILGAFWTGQPTGFRMLYMILFAPVIEELLKQSGMIYLLEKRPYRLFSAGQFVAAAVISALIFSAIENLVYIHIYSGAMSIQDPHAFACFRWIVCTLVHVLCSVIASFGLIQVWKRQIAEGRAADLAHGFWPFAVAMAIHGVYNLTVALLKIHF